MRVEILQENLKAGLATTGHAVAGKSTLPVLSNVLLHATEGKLKIAATNLEIGISTTIGAKVTENGAITVPAKLFTDIINGLKNGTIELTVDTKTVTLIIKTEKFESSIKGIEAEEFPTIPTLAGEPITSLDPAMLTAALEQVAFAAATDDTRPALAGVRFSAKKSAVKLAAADGFRLAYHTITSVHTPTPIEIIIPARATMELARILKGTTESVELRMTESNGQIMFSNSNFQLVSRLIEGKYPDIERIVPSSHSTRAILAVADLQKAVKLASYFATASSNIVRLTVPAEGPISIEANAAEVGDNKNHIVPKSINGTGTTIALNVRFFAEAIASIGTEDVAIELQTGTNPAVLKPVGDDVDMFQIIMPMSVR